MDLPDDVEILFIDDGSKPAINRDDYELKNFRIHPTNDCREWTWALARNKGAELAKGEYLLMADLDYIIPKGAIEDALELKEDRMNFRREFGVLDESGNFIQDKATLLKYGLTPERFRKKGFRIPAHTNDFVMKRETYFQLGGYRTDCIGKKYPQGEDRSFAKTWSRAYATEEVNRTQYRPLVYMFPNGKFCGDADYNPFGLFHNLSRK
jgi:glycosyltransferase involved in cell wall biosynthesis